MNDAIQFNSMGQCATITGIPPSEIKRAKLHCPEAFDAAGRVNLYPLLRWIFSPGNGGAELLDPAQCKARDLLASARLKEQKLKRAERELIDLEEAAKFIVETFSPLREFIVAMPHQLAALVNPNDPDHARRHLERFRDEFLKLRPQVPTKEKNEAD